jgi:hypothetical protein
MGRAHYKAVNKLWLAVLLLVAACVKDKPNPTPAPPPADTVNNVYVVCEGSLGNGNSSLSMYSAASGIAYEDVYTSANNQSLGDVFQSMTVIGDKLFLCVNNSDKVVVLNKADHKQVGIISIPKPRYILPLSADKAYVSTLYSKKIYIINPQSMSVTGSFDMPYENTEAMLLKDDMAYFCPWDTACDKVYIINTKTDAIERSITVAGRAPQGAVQDKDGNIWVVSGNVYKKKQAALTCINANNEVAKSFAFPDKADPMKPVFNKAGDMLYFIEVNYNGGNEYNGIYRMGINDASLPAAPFVQANKYQYFWALDVHPVSGDIYIGDPKGFTQKGAVYIYSADGTKTKEFATGVGPGRFYFD